MVETPSLSRRHLLRLGAGATLAAATPAWLSGCTPEATAPMPALGELRTALAWINNVEYAGLWVALENGYFDDEGVRPVLLPGGPNAPMPAVTVAARDAQLGFENDLRRLMDAILNGNDLVILGAQYQRSPGAVLSMATKPVHRPEDLLGSRFLGQEGVQVNIDAVLTRAGLPLDYDFIPVGYSVDPLVEGEGDAYSCFAVNQPITLQMKFGLEEGRDYVVTPWSELGLPSYANMIFTTRANVDAYFDALVGFLRATIKGWEASNRDPSVAARLAVSKYGAHLGLDLDQQTRQSELQVPFMQGPLTDAKGLFWMDAETLGGEMYASLAATGRGPMPPPDEVLDTRVLAAVYGNRSRLLDTGPEPEPTTQ